MKRAYNIVLLVIASSLGACAGASDDGTPDAGVEPGPPAAGASHTLTVVNGDPSGVYSPGTVIHLWPHPPSGPDRAFSHWSGSGAKHLSRPGEEYQRIVMPDEDMALEAVHKTITPVIYTERDLVTWLDPRFPVRANYFFPKKPVDKVLLFYHGGGGDHHVVERTEEAYFIRNWTSRGYGVVVPESYNRYSPQEDPDAAKNWAEGVVDCDTPDVSNQLELLRFLARQGYLHEDTVFTTLGMSNGGGFVSKVSEVIPTCEVFAGRRPRVVSRAIYIASGHSQNMVTTTIPTFWVLAAKDTSLRETGNADAMANYRTLVDRGVPAQLHVQEPTPLFANRFWRMLVDGNVSTPAVSREVFEVLRTAGKLDASGYLLGSPKDRSLVEAIPEAYTTEAHLLALSGQLRAAAADHTFLPNVNRAVTDFLDR